MTLQESTFRAQLLRAAELLDAPSADSEQAALARLGLTEVRAPSSLGRRWARGTLLASVGLAAGVALYVRPSLEPHPTRVEPEVQAAAALPPSASPSSTPRRVEERAPVAATPSAVKRELSVAAVPPPSALVEDTVAVVRAPERVPLEREQQMMVERSLEARARAMARRAAEERAAFAAAAQAGAAGALVVWDGDRVGTNASGWSGPDEEAHTIEALDTVGTGGSRGLRWRGVGHGWLGFGWNWCSWWPRDAGTDITGRRALVFSLRVEATTPAEAPNASGFMVSLSSSGGSGGRATRPLRLDRALPADVADGAWHRVVVPLAELLEAGSASGFDPRRVWELDLGYWSAGKVSFVAYLDDIAFE